MNPANGDLLNKLLRHNSTIFPVRLLLGYIGHPDNASLEFLSVLMHLEVVRLGKTTAVI